MQLARADRTLTSVFARRGPYVTVHLDVSRPAGAGIELVDERWGLVRDELAAAGAPDDDLDAIEEVLPLDVGAGLAFGMLAVAADGELCLRARTDPPSGSSSGAYAPLPVLLPFLRTRVPQIPHLIVVASAGRTRILRVRHGELDLLWPVDQGVDRLDSEAVSQAVARLASSVSPELVLVAGDEESSVGLVECIRPRLIADVEVQTIGAPAGDEALLRSVTTALHERDAGPRAGVFERLRRHAGDRRRVVSGARDVSAALRTAQLDALVIADDDAAVEARCWVGPRPTEFGTRDSEAAELGLAVVWHDRLGSALIRAAVATGARIVVVRPDEYRPQHAVEGLLR